MSYLTDQNLRNALDIPIQQPSVELKQSDWLVVSTVKVVSPSSLVYRFSNLRIQSSTVDLSLVDATNEINPSLGVAYLALYQNYTGGSPESLVALDVVSADAVGVFTRESAKLTLTTPANYSWVIVNNMTASTSNTNFTENVDLNLLVSGTARLNLES